jgi:hypothetical protein
MDQDKINQTIAWVIAVITGIFAYLRGRKAGPSPETPAQVTARESSVAERELARVRDLHQQERDARVELEIKAVRADFIVWGEALKESINGQFNDLRKQLSPLQESVRELERAMAVVKDRMDRPRR